MKVCILTTVHPPYNTRVFHKEAMSIAKVHDVIEIAPFNEQITDKVNRVKITTIKKPKQKIFHPLTILKIFKTGLDVDCDVYHCFEPISLFVCLLIKIIKNKKVIYDGHEHYPFLIAEN
ncbi:MAG: glycosyltransferase WbuB, partial [Methanofollis liminatans]|nr:glycosyltransferase WbuB [Methanofollis liminatans]